MRRCTPGKEELKQQQKEAERARIKEATDLAKRLAKVAGPLASSSNNFRVTASGRIAGLLTGTPTFRNLVSRKTEVKKLLYSLEGGSSSAQKSFKEVCLCSPLYLYECGRKRDTHDLFSSPL